MQPENQGTTRAPASAPATAATGTIGAGIGQAVTVAILTAYPELVVLAPIAGTFATGALNGLAKMARDRRAGEPSGLGYLLASGFAFLG